MNSPDDLETPHDPTGETTGQMNDQLSGVAAAIDVDDQKMALTTVRDTVQRRRRRRQLISGAAGAAAGAVLLIGGVVVYQGLDDGESGTIAIDAGDTEATADEEAVADATGSASAADSDEPSSEQAAQVATVSSRVVERVDATSTQITIGSDASVDGDHQVEWIVPWQGGFLASKYSYAPQPLPDELPEEVAALFPQEVLDLFPDGLPPTINEATTVLSEAGLLDEVAEIISNNAAASDAIYGAGSADQNRDVVFSADGVSWESIDIDLPEGVTEMYGVQSTGTRLAFPARIWPEVPVGVEPNWAMPASPVVVVSTVDLVNWDVVEIDVAQRPADLPDELMFNVSPTTLAMNDARWMVGLDTYIDVDVEKILPDDIRERMGTENFGWSTDEQGVTVEVYEDVPVETALDGSDDEEFMEPVPTEVVSFTWEELGVDPTLLEGSGGFGGPGASRIVTSLWGEAPVDAASAENTWMIVAADNGFYLPNGPTLLFSVDGASWDAIDLPDEVEYLSSVVGVGAGIVAFGSDDTGTTTVLGLADPAGPWERLEIPGAPASMNPMFGNGGSSAMLIDATEQAQFTSSEVTVEVDGYTLVMRSERMSQTITVTDESGALITDETIDYGDNQEPTTWRFARSGLEILDVDTGEVLVTFGNDVMEQAFREQTDMPAVDEEYQFDSWLIATVDGERWLVEDLDEVVDQFDGPGGPGGAAISGNIVVVGSGENWQRFELN